MWEDAAFLKDAWALGSCLTNTLRFIQERRRGPDHHLLGAHRLTAALVNFGPTSRLSVISCGFMPLVIVVMMMMVKTMMCSPIPSPGTLGKPGKTPLTTTLPGTLLHRGHLPESKRMSGPQWSAWHASQPPCQAVRTNPKALPRALAVFSRTSSSMPVHRFHCRWASGQFSCGPGSVFWLSCDHLPAAESAPGS